ncbi:MAG: hypothetical protein BRC31_08730 [Actinobacteria bacterium QS_5_72_10]|jgi:hypothetical protein|nr:MAG: hypothetical protein BRC31_08730 [Actinobacteria bacterium QS_5_72_10]
MAGVTDYRMAKRALVAEVSRGARPLADVCDAHPDLLRAARNAGTVMRADCPICELADDRADVARDDVALRQVVYVFGDSLRRRSGGLVWSREELAGMAATYDSFTAYVVECCLVCGWNHLVESHLLGTQHGSRPRPAVP